MNIGWWVAAFAPLGVGLCLVCAVALLWARHRGLPTGPVWGALVVLSVTAVAAAWWRVRGRRWTVEDGLARLDLMLHLEGRLIAAAEGVGAWPEAASEEARLRWRLKPLLGPVAAGLGVVLAAAWIPMAPAPAAPAPPAAEPAAWSRIEEGLEILEEEPLVAEEARARWEARLEELESAPADTWFDHAQQEAADHLWERMRRSVARAEHAVEPVERALESVERAHREGRPTESAARRLAEALEDPDLARAPLSQELAQRLKEIRPEDVDALSQDAVKKLRRDLRRARAAGRRARRARPGDGPGRRKKPGSGRPNRGPGTAPIELTGDEAPRHDLAPERLTAEDRRRAALGDVVRMDAIAPEVEPGADRGPAAGGAVNETGRGGEAVWRVRLDPEEQRFLGRYFE